MAPVAQQQQRGLAAAAAAAVQLGTTLQAQTLHSTHKKLEEGLKEKLSLMMSCGS
jgi:hypothetical protein